MKIKEKTEENILILTLEGKLDSHTSLQLEEKLLQAIKNKTNKIIVNCASLSYLSSAGIRILIHCHKEIEKRQGYVYLTNISPAIENILYITGFLPYFKIFPEESEALEAMQRE